MRFYLLRLFILAPFFSFSQAKLSVSVSNLPKAGETAGAVVFLSNTTFHCDLVQGGTFSLNDVKPGRYDLIVSVPGFQTYLQSILVGGQDIQLAPINLVGESFQPGIEKPKHDGRWNRLYKDFTAAFFGNSIYAKDCTVLNPDSLNLNYDGESRQLTANSNGFLLIENKALGYHIKYLLERFVDDNRRQTQVCKGYGLFEELAGGSANSINFSKNRQICYQGSAMQFFRSLISDKMDIQGFEVYKSIQKLKPDYESDTEYIKPDSVLTRNDLFKATSQPGIYSVDAPVLYVIYKSTRDYGKLPAYKQVKSPKWKGATMPDQETTLVTLLKPQALFDNNGILTDPSAVDYDGYWAISSFAESLPANYNPK